MSMGMRWAVGVALLAMTATAGAAGKAKKAKSADMNAQEIRACMSNNLVARGALRDLALEVSDKEGPVSKLRMRLYWKPSKSGGTRVHIKIVDPPAMAGSSYLMLQEGANEEVYFALPGADRGLRITGQNMSEPLWGTDFSYGEIKEVLGMLVGGATTKGADGTVAERPTWTLETKTAGGGAYDRVVSSVDKKSCTLLQSDFMKGEKARKTLKADVTTLLQADKYWTVLGYTMTDHDKGSHTTLSLTDLSFDETMPEKLFDPQRFHEPLK